MIRPQIPTLNRQTVVTAEANSNAGFTLLETVVAMFILTIGLLALASTIGYALMVSNSGRGITNTKLLVVSVLEQMETLRNNGQLTFGQIANVGQVDNGGAGDFAGFQSGFQPVSINPGPDGIFGTSDDLTDAGDDLEFGTPDDFTNPSLARGGITREILITSLSPQLKRIQVTLRYTANGGDQKELVGVSYLNDNSRSNYLE
jgi:prepilin-type N-terminal cleavage/methylation domain-containing protein